MNIHEIAADSVSAVEALEKAVASSIPPYPTDTQPERFARRLDLAVQIYAAKVIAEAVRSTDDMP